MSPSKNILVTGASSGIGAAITARLAKDGHQVIGTHRASPGKNADGIEMLELDVCSDESTKRCVAACLQKAGHIDVLINNAGYLVAGAIEEVSLEQAHEQFQTNYFGVVRMVKAVLPSMRARNSGLLAATSSLAGMVPLPFWGYYNASKFAVRGIDGDAASRAQAAGHSRRDGRAGDRSRRRSMPSREPLRWRSTRPGASASSTSMKGYEDKAPGPEVVAERFLENREEQEPSAAQHRHRRGQALPFPALAIARRGLRGRPAQRLQARQVITAAGRERRCCRCRRCRGCRRRPSQGPSGIQTRQTRAGHPENRVGRWD